TGRQLRGRAAGAVAGDTDRRVGIHRYVDRRGRADPDRADLNRDHGLVGRLATTGSTCSTGVRGSAACLLARVAAGAVTRDADRGVAVDGCVDGRRRVDVGRADLTRADRLVGALASSPAPSGTLGRAPTCRLSRRATGATAG